MPELERVMNELVRVERARILASLARRYGLDVAEQAVDDALEAALLAFRAEGLPERPAAWLQRVASRRAIDAARHAAIRARFVMLADPPSGAVDPLEEAPFGDDLLRLVFTCCHPALSDEAKVALALRMVAGLTTEEVARAFLVREDAMAARLVRAKQRIREAGIPFAIPERSELPERIEGVVAVIYLVFNEGYVATRGELARSELCRDAIRLAELLIALCPEEASPRALLALMLLVDARRDAREADGELVLLEAQDRSRWDREAIARGEALLVEALTLGPPSRYAIEAAIQAVHGRAETFERTDQAQIAALYGLLRAKGDTPLLALNEAAALAFVEGPRAALRRVNALVREGALDAHHLLWATCADLHRRLGDRSAARRDYARALERVTNDAERRFLRRRLAELSDA